jgi:predicted GH43/DUF377 family glycosyl hydrolase
MYVAKRSQKNPLIVPNKNHYWEEFATFNVCPIKKGATVYGLYRAISASDQMRTPHQVSVIGITKSKDGENFGETDTFIIPEKEWEQYGCEDPRVTYFEGKFYIFYTALSKYPLGPEGIKVAVAISKDLKKVESRHFVTPFNAKAMTLFPERINGKIVVMFSAHTDMPPAKMVFAYLDKIEELWSPVFWEKWSENINSHIIDPRRNPYDHVEVGAPPLKTKYGWLLVYSHIQNYFPNPDKLAPIFGIEAILLDLKDPTKIIGHTRGPILVPEEQYELSGYIANVIFPSGALIEKDTLKIYYGAADTTSCMARVNLTDLIYSMHYRYADTYRFKRFLGNPIIAPKPENLFESKATFNPASVTIGDKIYILYRTLSEDNTSTIGLAVTKNGYDIIERLDKPIYVPREDFEIKKIPNANSGCEDPRLTKIGNKIYMCYTAFDSYGPPRVAITSILEKDLVAKNFNWAKPFLITPGDVDDKDTCILPEKFKDGYFVLHRINSMICGDYLSSLEFNSEPVKKCLRILGPRVNTWDSLKVGIACPPIKTKKGWLLLYHGVSKSHSTYRVGAVLLDLKDPAIVLARGSEPIFEPEEQYEKIGIVNNVVFPCGMEVKKDLLFIYYGGADRVVGVATMKLDIILKTLTNSIKY